VYEHFIARDYHFRKPLDNMKKAMVRNLEMGAKLWKFNVVVFVTLRLSGYQFCLLVWRSGSRVPAPRPTTLGYYWFCLFTESQLLNNATDEARLLPSATSQFFIE